MQLFDRRHEIFMRIAVELEEIWAGPKVFLLQKKKELTKAFFLQFYMMAMMMSEG